jgi:hypothetical protein
MNLSNAGKWPQGFRNVGDVQHRLKQHGPASADIVDQISQFHRLRKSVNEGRADGIPFDIQQLQADKSFCGGGQCCLTALAGCIIEPIT